MLEKEIEKKVCDYAKREGWLVYKFSSPGQKGVPDRMFMKAGKIFFIEFKAPGKRPTMLQQVAFDKIRKIGGMCVHIVDDVTQGKDLVDAA